MIRLTNLIIAIMFAAAVSAQPQSQNNSSTSNLQQKAEQELAQGHRASARSYYVMAYEDYAKKGDIKASVDCGVKATAL